MKYLELFKNGFDSTIVEKIKPENWPYVGYSPSEGLRLSMILEENQSGYQMVDLGLPSGLKWADRNVGATNPEDAGLYFQWGDTVGYTADQIGKDKVFDWDSYFDVSRDENNNPALDGWGSPISFEKYSRLDLTILESVDDAATVHMGSKYRMPTSTEIQELINNTTKTFIDLDGNEYIKGTDTINIVKGKLKGIRFTGSNGNSIFIPAAGFCNGPLYSVGANGSLWSSSFHWDAYDYYAEYLDFSYSGSMYGSYNHRFFGLSVRGVQA